MNKRSLALALTALATFAAAGLSAETYPVGTTGSLGIDTSTTFAWDANDNSTGLETKAGIELVFDLFPRGDYGVIPENTDDPTVRLIVKNAAFSWWNTYKTTGGNYEQDNFNSWNAQPLILTFDDVVSDIVWKEWFFRVASSETVMNSDKTSLKSIFDDVMDADSRMYVGKGKALYYTTRYNTLDLPLLGDLINRNMIGTDMRSSISGSLAAGMEKDKLGFAVKAASYESGEANNENAWVFGADFDASPVENLKVSATGLAAVNYDKAGEDNPYAAGVSAEYLVPLSEKIILKPFAGFDFAYEKTTSESTWEAGAGTYLYLRGLDETVSHRSVDRDDVIPVGMSVAMNINNDQQANLIAAWFDSADEKSLIKNFGGFAQLEVSDLLGKADGRQVAVIGQLEYLVGGKVLPYVSERYAPEIVSSATTGATLFGTSIGCLLTPISNFSVDVRYERTDRKETDGAMTLDKGLLSVIFNISM